MGEILNSRRQQTAQRISDLQKVVTASRDLCGEFACVYATGSFGRGDASPYSDLDVFIACDGTRKEPALTNLNAILIKADLIKAAKALAFPEFSGDGEYLNHYSVEELVMALGTPEDDASNTFTARLLLLLESFPLVGKVAHAKITRHVVDAYWRDYGDHKNSFMPAFLANDILRIWRTFCVNYEARTLDDPPEKKAKRKLKNFKLKHSRLLTCYSALLYLLTVYSKQRTVNPDDAMTMIQLTPTGRLEWIASQTNMSDTQHTIAKLLHCYEEFLDMTNVPESELISLFMDKQKYAPFIESSYRFGDLVFGLLEEIRVKNPNDQFHRLIVV